MDDFSVFGSNFDECLHHLQIILRRCEYCNLVLNWEKCHFMVLVFVLAAFCWTKSLLCNVAAFTGMLLYPESTLQLCSSRRLCDVFKEVHSGSLSAIQTTWKSGRSSVSNICPYGEIFPSGRPSVSRSFEQFKSASVRT